MKYYDSEENCETFVRVASVEIFAALCSHVGYPPDERARSLRAREAVESARTLLRELKK